MTIERSVSEIVTEALGDQRFEFDDEQPDVVTGVMVLVTTLDAEGQVGLAVKYEPTMDWMRRIGVLRSALVIEERDLGDWYLKRDD